MKTIPVNLGDNIYEAQVDDEDYEFLSQFRWKFSGSSLTAYANTYVPTGEGYKNVSMHRMVIGDAEEDWNNTLGVGRLKFAWTMGKLSLLYRRSIAL